MAGSNIYFSGKWKSQTFTSNDTFTVPSNVTSVIVEMYGGGGSGANVFNGAAASDRGYGGEAGNYVVKPIIVTPAANITVTIGTGGAGQGVNGSNGNDGTDTSFGSVFARGGRGGQNETGATPFDHSLGSGVGRDSVYSTGGASATSGATGYGGDGAHGAGSDAVTSGTSAVGGTGAGSGAALGASSSGAGGDGICIVYYKQD